MQNSKNINAAAITATKPDILATSESFSRGVVFIPIKATMQDSIIIVKRILNIICAIHIKLI